MHDPKSKAASNAGCFIGMSDEVLCKVVRQSRALVADFDYERAFRDARSQIDGSLCGRRGASVDQEIEYDLPHAFDGDGNGIVEVVDPIELNPLSQSFRLDEQSKIVDVNSAQRTRLAASRLYVTRVDRTTFRMWVRPRSRRFSVASRSLPVVAVTAQRVDGIEKAA